jgi:hypothetical protein
MSRYPSPTAKSEAPEKQGAGLALPSAAKEAMLKVLTECLERLVSVTERVKSAAESSEQLEAPVPAEIGREISAIADLLGGADTRYPAPMAQEPTQEQEPKMAETTKQADAAVEPTPTDSAPAEVVSDPVVVSEPTVVVEPEVAKAAPDRMGKLREALTVLTKLIEELAGEPPTVVEESDKRLDAEVPQPDPAAETYGNVGVGPEGDKRVGETIADDVPGLADVMKRLESMDKIVKSLVETPDVPASRPEPVPTGKNSLPPRSNGRQRRGGPWIL